MRKGPLFRHLRYTIVGAPATCDFLQLRFMLAISQDANDILMHCLEKQRIPRR